MVRNCPEKAAFGDVEVVELEPVTYSCVIDAPAPTLLGRERAFEAGKLVHEFSANLLTLSANGRTIKDERELSRFCGGSLF